MNQLYSDSVTLFFTSADLDYLKSNVSEIKLLSPETSKWCRVTHHDQKIYYEIKGVAPSYFKLRLLEAQEGRIFHPLDGIEGRKVTLIGSNVADVLFKRQNPIGKTILINDDNFIVVGVIADNVLNQYEARQITCLSCHLHVILSLIHVFG